MSAPAWTPGPWSIDNRNAATSPPAHVIVSEHAIIGEVFAESDENEPEAVATASLIAAAPELYEALIEVINTGLNGGNNMRLAFIATGGKALDDDLLAKAERSEAAVRKALAALAKARGES